MAMHMPCNFQGSTEHKWTFSLCYIIYMYMQTITENYQADYIRIYMYMYIIYYNGFTAPEKTSEK